MQCLYILNVLNSNVVIINVSFGIYLNIHVSVEITFKVCYTLNACQYIQL